jgi:hypothetical protein
MGFTIMIPTPYYFFCVMRNIKTFVTTGKPEDLETKIFNGVYDKQPDFMKNICKKIWNEYENGFFTNKEFKIYLLYIHLMNKKTFQIKDINTNEVKKVCMLFSDEQWNKDKQIIEAICKNINIKNVKHFLEMKLEGTENTVDKLIREQKISPIIWIKYADKLYNKEIKEKRIINKLKQIINDN